jgi:hypothetical protein
VHIDIVHRHNTLHPSPLPSQTWLCQDFSLGHTHLAHVGSPYTPRAEVCSQQSPDDVAGLALAADDQELWQFRLAVSRLSIPATPPRSQADWTCDL